MEKAKAAYEFKLLCERSDTMLRKVVLSQNSKFEGVLQENIDSILINKQSEIDANIEYKYSDKLNHSKFLSENFKIFNVDELSLNTDSEELYITNSRFGNSNRLDNFMKIEPEKCDNDEHDKNTNFSLSTSSKIYKCDLCLESFTEKPLFDMHKKIHDSISNNNCHLCGKSFTRLSSLQLHVLKHSEFKAHLCPICGERFHLAGGLHQHLKYHRGIKPHLCEYCDKRYYNIHLLKEHVRCAHSNNRYNYECSVCKKKFTAKSTLKMHIKIHTGELPHACETCGKRFTRATYLRTHIRKHTLEPAPKQFLCSYENCSRTFTAKASLDLHIRYKHTKEKPFTCENCGKAFSSMPGLSEHRRIHTGDKPEECTVCNNRFVNKQSLKKHMRLHTGEKPYLCSYCGERFLSSSRRSEHIQCKHMEKQHECSVCHKKFHLKRTLTGHMRIHSGQHTKILPLPIIVSDTKQNVPELGFEVIV